MRRWMCVPMITLLLLSGCGETAQETESTLDLYRQMSGCHMEAEVRGGWQETEEAFALRCAYVPEGETTVEVLSPETAAGVKAVLEGDTLFLTYEDLCLPAGTVSAQRLSPAAALPCLMQALREGWLLEENWERWGETDCLRLTLDCSGPEEGKIVSTLWLRQTDGLPLRGEIGVDGKIIFTAEFTSFAFYDTIDPIS